MFKLTNKLGCEFALRFTLKCCYILNRLAVATGLLIRAFIVVPKEELLRVHGELKIRKLVMPIWFSYCHGLLAYSIKYDQLNSQNYLRKCVLPINHIFILLIW